MDISQFQPTERFSSVVEDYSLYRPSYPNQLIHILQETYSLRPEHTIADVGAGTGILTELLLQNKNKVLAVEPNDRMREVCEQKLSVYPNFHSIKGTAESMDIEGNSIDLITCAQSFHWFDYGKTIPEFQRILKEDGIIALIWNERKHTEDGLMFQYENLLNDYCEEYKDINHKKLSYELFQTLFPDRDIKVHKIDNHQDMNLESFKGRLRSCSYCPKPEHKQYVPLMDEMDRLFSIFQNNGKVRFTYVTQLYCILNQ